jgi:hypothetical protein
LIKWIIKTPRLFSFVIAEIFILNVQTIHMQFHKIGEIKILNKMVRTLEKNIYSAKNNPKCRNNLNKVDNKKLRLLSFIIVKMFV